MESFERSFEITKESAGNEKVTYKIVLYSEEYYWDKNNYGEEGVNIEDGCRAAIDLLCGNEKIGELSLYLIKYSGKYYLFNEYL